MLEPTGIKLVSKKLVEVCVMFTAGQVGEAGEVMVNVLTADSAVWLSNIVSVVAAADDRLPDPLQVPESVAEVMETVKLFVSPFASSAFCALCSGKDNAETTGTAGAGLLLPPPPPPHPAISVDANSVSAIPLLRILITNPPKTCEKQHRRILSFALLIEMRDKAEFYYKDNTCIKTPNRDIYRDNMADKFERRAQP